MPKVRATSLTTWTLPHKIKRNLSRHDGPIRVKNGRPNPTKCRTVDYMVPYFKSLFPWASRQSSDEHESRDAILRSKLAGGFSGLETNFNSYPNFECTPARLKEDLKCILRKEMCDVQVIHINQDWKTFFSAISHHETFCSALHSALRIYLISFLMAPLMER